MKRVILFLSFTLTILFSAALNSAPIAKMSVAYLNLGCVKESAAEGAVNVNNSGLDIVEPGKLTSSQQDLMHGVVARARNLLVDQESLKSVKVRVFEGGRGGKCTSFTPGEIHLVNNCNGMSGDTTVKHFTHELGHVIGQSNNNYAAYAKAPKCDITTYCSANHGFGARNEEFAEVAASYILAPDKLRSVCGPTVDWLEANGIFKRDGSKGACKGGGSSSDVRAIAASFPAGNGGAVAGPMPAFNSSMDSSMSLDPGAFGSLMSQAMQMYLATQMMKQGQPQQQMASQQGAQPAAVDQSAGIKDAPTPASVGPAPLPNNGPSTPVTGYTEEVRQPASNSAPVPAGSTGQ